MNFIDSIEKDKVYSQTQEVCNIIEKNISSSDVNNMQPESSKIKNTIFFEKMQISSENSSIINLDLNNHVVATIHENVIEVPTNLLKVVSDISSNKDKNKFNDKDEQNMNTAIYQTNESKKFDEISKSKRISNKMSSISSETLEKIIETGLNGLNDSKEFCDDTKDKTNKQKKHSKIKSTSSPTPEAFYDFLTSDNHLHNSKGVQLKTHEQESKFSSCCPSMIKTQKSNISTKKHDIQSMSNQRPKISLKFQKCDPTHLGQNAYKIYSHDLFVALEEHELRLLKGKKVKAKSDNKKWKDSRKVSKRSQSIQCPSCMSCDNEAYLDISRDYKNKSDEGIYYHKKLYCLELKYEYHIKLTPYVNKNNYF